MSLAEIETMMVALEIRRGKRHPTVSEADREAGMNALRDMFKNDEKVRLH